jgi:aminoglycoside phosphotransferase
VRCCGTATGHRFFAKILLADPYPVTVVVPWKEAFRPAVEWRTAEEQVETESSAAQQLRLLLAETNIPRLLGKSREAKTVVWEQVKAHSALDLVKRSRWLDAKGHTCTAVLLQAGQWLRQVHDKTTCGTETLDIRAMADAIRRVMAQHECSPFVEHAGTVLESGLQELQASTLAVPAGLNHGDFTLANLLWDRRAGKLWVVDFENPTHAGIWQDLATMVFSLRKQLLNPLVPHDIIRAMERAFWMGYGAISRDLLVFIHMLVASQILFYYPDRLATRQERHGWLAGVGGSLYRSFLLPGMLSRCLDVPSSDPVKYA